MGFVWNNDPQAHGNKSSPFGCYPSNVQVDRKVLQQI